MAFARRLYDQQLEDLRQELLRDRGEDIKNKIKDPLAKGVVFVHINFKKGEEDDIQSLGLNTNFPTTAWHMMRNAIIYVGRDPTAYKISAIHLFNYVAGDFQAQPTPPESVPLKEACIAISRHDKKPLKFMAIVEKVEKSIMDEIKKFEIRNSRNFWDANPPLIPRSHISCGKTLECGHLCGGIRNEGECLPCIICAPPRIRGNQRSADDPCTICMERIGSSPFIQLRCSHLFHFNCVRDVLEKGWNGVAINFRFMNCPECNEEMSHPSLEAILSRKRILKAEVSKKALDRLEADGLLNNPKITTIGSNFYNNPREFALHHYAFVQCHKCEKAYCFGTHNCMAQLDPAHIKPEILLCSGCSHTVGIESCEVHGKNYIDYKCRYCCSMALFFCFGTHHFCDACHRKHFQLRVTREFPRCPVGPGCNQLPDGPCPLGLQEAHPSTGEEFSLGCHICRSVRIV